MNIATWSFRTRPGAMTDGRVAVGIAVVLVSVLVLPVPAWLAVLVIAMASRPHDPVTRVHGPRPALANWLIVSLAFVGAAAVTMLGKPLTAHGVQLLVWFTLLPAVAALFWLQGRRAYTVAALWWGATVAASTAGVVAIVQVSVLGAPRATGVVANSITFGNVAVVMGAVSIALHRLVDLPRRATLPASLAAGALGLIASILSGSRGGWLAVPLLIAALLWQARSELTPRRACGIAAALVCVVALSNALADGMPTKRTSASVTNVSDYRPAAPTSESAASSEGARIEAWHSALDAFEQQPMTGLGWGNLATYFDREVALGLRNERIATFGHAHNQLLGAAANGGVIGLSMAVLLLIVPLAIFARAMGSGSDRQRTLGATGVMVLGAYAVFGMTEAVLENLVPVTVLAVLVAALCSELDADRGGARPPDRHASFQSVGTRWPASLPSTADRRSALFGFGDRRPAR